MYCTLPFCLVSPIRGPQINPVLGTPENIRSKQAPKPQQTKGQKKNVRRASTRHTGMYPW